MKGKEYSDRGKAFVLYSTIYSCCSPSFTAAATIIFSLIIYMTLTTLKLAQLASICNYGEGLLFLGLHEVVYAGRPAGRPAFEARGPVGPVGNTART